MKKVNVVLGALLVAAACGGTPSPSGTPPPSPSGTPPPAVQMKTLSVGVAGQGTVEFRTSDQASACTSRCDVSVPEGSTVLLIAHPGDGFTFQGFGNVCSNAVINGSNDCNVVVNGDITLQVVFQQVPPPPPSKHTLVINRTGNGQCTVIAAAVGLSCGVNCVGDADDGQAVVLVVQPDPDSAFTGWKGGPCDGNRDPTCSVRMDKDLTVSARCMRIVCSVDP